MASLLVLVSVAALPAASSAGSAIVQCGFFDCAPTSDPAAPLAVGVPMRPGSSRSLNVKFLSATGTVLKCSLDGAAEVDCTNGLKKNLLSVATHTLDVVSVKTAGGARSGINHLSWQITSPVTAPSATGTAPTLVFAGTYPANYWDITLDGAFNTNDPKGKRPHASRLMGVQLSSAVDQPSDTEAAPASNDPHIAGYRANHLQWIGKKPLWVRVENAAGGWSGWTAFLG